MFITKKCVSRREVLRGIGATIALPLLDGMVPAFAAVQTTAAKPVRRFGAVYVPNGMNIWKWTPDREGATFEFTPILQPLAPYRDRLVVLSGLSNTIADSFAGEGSGDHSRGQTAFLTGVHAKKTQGSDVQAGVSMDQIIARELGKETQLASLELALEVNDLVGACELGLACAYTGTIAWSGPTTPLPMERDPRAVFERMFGASGSTDQRARLERIEKERSILDSVSGDLARLQRRLGGGDRNRLTEYLEALRDIERRIQRAEEQSTRELPLVEQPAGIPGTFEEHAKIMFDLMALAYQTDLTRVSTYLMGREQSLRTYPEIGVPEPHHPTSHHNGDPVALEKLARINTLHLQMFAHFVEKLRSTPDGDGSLLDHSTIIYGAGLSNPDVHDHHQLPLLLVGGGGGQIKGGRHLKYPADTPMTNLHLAVLDKLGISVENFGDSTGKLELLSGV
jgi:Protein of unknown function (DUF1552)